MIRKYGRYFLLYALAGLMGVGLLHASQSVKRAKDELRTLQKQTAQEIEGLRVLRAEWSYLNNPEHLEQLAAQQLTLVAPVPDQMRSELDELMQEMPVLNVPGVPGVKPDFAGSLKPAPLPRPEMQSSALIKRLAKPEKRNALPGSFDDLMQRLDGEGL